MQRMLARGVLTLAFSIGLNGCVGSDSGSELNPAADPSSTHQDSNFSGHSNTTSDTNNEVKS